MYKVLLYSYKALHGYPPQYISDLIGQYKLTRYLRSAMRYLFVFHKLNTSKYGGRLFKVTAPKLWNEMTQSLKIKVLHVGKKTI